MFGRRQMHIMRGAGFLLHIRLFLPRGHKLSYISSLFNDIQFETIQPFNKDITNALYIVSGSRMNIPFSCDCLGDGAYLGHKFQYILPFGDTYEKIAHHYANLTTSSWLQKANPLYDPYNIPDGGVVNVTINCSCGDPQISKDYGFFVTYPLRENDTLADVSKTYNISSSLLGKYNPTVKFSQTQGIVYVPVKDQNGSYRPLHISGSGIGAGTIAGISVGSVVALLFLATGLFYFYVYKPKKTKSSLLPQLIDKDGSQTNSANRQGSTPHGLTDITGDKSVEFSYQELAESTNNFNIANKIGEGGFGVVYYAELQGEKAAIKKMDMKATKEFLAELKVLTHVHHLNLVRLIGFCTEESLFLVYEFIENGNLSQHLCGSGMQPLSRSARVQIALDSARGLEYIHEHTVPVYIHRDIKSANILIDKNFRGKVADFGLTKLTEVGGASSTLPTRLVGTLGYMPPK